MHFFSNLVGSLSLFSTVARLANPLPKPVKLDWSRSAEPVYFDPDFSLRFSSENDNGGDLQIPPVLEQAFEKTKKALWTEGFYTLDDDFKPPENPSSKIQWVEVSVEQPNADLQNGVDESYIMSSTKEGIKISAATVWGIIHAFSTLEQLAITDPEDNVFVEGTFHIEDKPMYPYRGLMVDVSRNFYTVESLLRQIDGLYLSKMNVLHLHLSDSQSWPIEIKSFPDMTKDAYSKREIYSINDIKNIVAYGKLRGVRVIPELDLPGHSNAGWKRIDPELIVCGNTNWEITAFEPTPGQLDVLNDKTYEIVEKVYDDVTELFDDNFFHVGLDELRIQCFETSDEIMKFINEGHSFSDLTQIWVDRTLPIFNKVPDRRLVMWQDSVLSHDIPAHNIPTNVVMHAWMDGVGAVKNLTSMGYDVIVSSCDFWYLDCGAGAWPLNDVNVEVQSNPSPDQFTYNYGGNGGSHCAPYKTWQRIYSFNFESSLTPEEHTHILGGSVNLWSEQSDSTVIDSKVWPRSAAAGERLWSGNKDKYGNIRLQDLGPRILQFRERLLAKGIGAIPLTPKNCLKDPESCAFGSSRGH